MKKFTVFITQEDKTFKTTISAPTKEAAESVAKEAYLKKIGVFVSATEVLPKKQAVAELEKLLKIFGDIFKI